MEHKEYTTPDGITVRLHFPTDAQTATEREYQMAKCFAACLRVTQSATTQDETQQDALQ